MNYRGNARLRELLSAEYVLGTLKGGARRRFEAWLAEDAALRRTTGEWQERLLPMTEFTNAETPPGRVWSGIERRLKLERKAPAWQFWRQGPERIWQPVGMAGVATALVLAVMLATRVPAPAIEQVATLTDEQARTALVVTADLGKRSMDVRVADTVTVPGDKSLHLWAIPKVGNPRSLGVLADTRQASLALPDKAIGSEVVMLAISLEPKGGSPDPNGPTGPVIYKGSWVRLL